MDQPSRGSIFRGRVLLGFAAAPIAPAVVLALLHLFTGDTRVLRDISFSLGMGYITLLVLGVPGYILFQRLGWTRLPIYAAFGALLGIAAFLAATASGSLARTFGIWEILVRQPLSVLGGVIVGIVFWLIARPDQQ